MTPTKNVYLYLISKVWKYAGEKRKHLIFHIIASIIANIFYVLVPYFFGLAINIIQEGGANVLYNFGIMLIYILVLLLVFWILHHFVSRILDIEVGFFCKRNFKIQLYNTVSKMDTEWLQNNHSGKIIDKINRGTNAIEKFIKDYNFMVIEAFFRMIGAIVMTIIVFPYIGFFVFTLLALALIISLNFDKIAIEYYKEIAKKEHYVASLLHDYITNITTIITLRLEDITKKEIFNNINPIFKLTRKSRFIWESKWFLNGFFSTIIRLLVVFFYCVYSLNLKGTIMIGSLMMLREYTKNIDSSLGEFNSLYSNLIQCKTDLEIADSINIESEKIYNKHKSLKTLNVKNWKKIEIKNLNFIYKDYQNDKNSKIENINLVLEKGKKIAFIGESGSGKTTLMKLIRGIYIADQFELIVDGKNIKNTGLSNITTLFPQEPDIFENTIQYNVTFGLNSSKKEILKNIEMACFKKSLDKLPNGLKTNINEKGVNLSGGEKQRLALARGLFASKKSDILLFDEPTSSVDPINEKEIYQNIFKEFGEKCIISSIHRYYLLEQFDYIYIFDKGKIIQEGNYNEIKKYII